MAAPPYWQPLEGRELVAHLLGIIVTLVEDFAYHREWVSGNELALEFRGRIAGRGLQGIDLISLGDDGRIVRFDDAVAHLAQR
jgi:hypothetical protein